MNTAYQKLETFFEQTLKDIQRMQGVLEWEAECLKNRDAEGLNKSSKEKEALADHIHLLTQRHYAFLASHRLPPNREGVERLLSLLPANDPSAHALRTRWLEIQALTNACNKLNETNGAYIGLLRQHAQRSLNALHGQSSQELVYGPDGVSHRPSATRKLISV